MSDWIWLALLVVAYLCGSIPVGLLLGKAHGVDVRGVGSGNIGATNVSRALGRRWGIACFFLDLLKGLAPVLAGGLLMEWIHQEHLAPAQSWRWLALAAAAVAGHIFPIWLQFRGGKGVATGLGVMLGVWPILTLPGMLTGLTWVLFVAAFRYVSLASIAGALALPFYVLLLGWLGGRTLREVSPFALTAAALSLLVIWRHRSNMARLWAGTEQRMDRPAAPPAHGSDPS